MAQTPRSWPVDPRVHRSGGGHKRSASWGNAECLTEHSTLRHQLKKRSRQAPREGAHREASSLVPGATQRVPLVSINGLSPNLQHSVEELNLELEGVFVSDSTGKHCSALDVPDGHRAPIPLQRCSSGSQSDPSPTLLSPCSSPQPAETELAGSGPFSLSPSPPTIGTVSSPMWVPPFPKPNKSCCYQEELSEDCEEEELCEEAIYPTTSQQVLHTSRPDTNKVNFTPHGDSAFCPVSLLKPILPSVDFLFRGLSVSPVTGCSVTQGGEYGTDGNMGPYIDSMTPS